MRLLGALAAAIAVFYAIGLATGRVPKLRIGLGTSRFRPEISDRQLWLRQAGLDLTPLQYYAAIGFVALIVFGVVATLTGAPPVALAPAAIAAAIPHSFFGRKRIRNMGKTQHAWPDAIREVMSSIESNSSLHGALVQLAYKGPDALKPAFERFPTHASTVGVVPALEAVRERLADPTSDRVIEVLILAHERGGSIISEILRDLARTTTEDLQLLEEIENSQLEQKINGRAVFFLPWIVLIMLVVTNGQFKAFYQSTWGLLVVFSGAAMSVFGMWILSRLGRDKPEMRVFGGSATLISNGSATEPSLSDNPEQS